MMTGWQTTSQDEAERIRKKYSTPDAAAPAVASPVPGLPPASAGAAGPTGNESADTGMSPWEAPVFGTPDATDKTAGSPGATGFPDAASASDAPAPAENATQRWSNSAANSTERYYTRMAGQSKRGADRVGRLMARRIAPGPGNIPGYGTPSAKNYTPNPVSFKDSPTQWDPSSPAPVTFNNSPSGWSPY